MRVMIADDHEAVRRSLRAILSSWRGCEAIAEADTGDEAVRLAVIERPDIAVLDVRMPVMNGMAAAARIAERSPGTLILMSSLSHEAEYIAGALAAGAHGYIGKDEAASQLVPALEAIRAGKYYLSPAAAAQILEYAGSARYASIARDILMLFDRNAAVLMRCALVAGANELAAKAVHQTFLAYLLARAGVQHIPNVAAWLFASVAAFAYECSTSAGLERESRFGPSGVRSWWSARLQPHPAISAFVSYWAGGMRDAARSRLLKHVRRCPLCHLEWSLAGAARAGIVPEDGMLEGRTREIRAQLENDLKRCDLGSLAAMLREHNKRLNVLLTSELEMFFGAAAASHWSFTEEPRRTFASPLITEFLGVHTASLATTVRNA